MSFSNNGVDISFQRDDIFRRSRRLICFDMDSTLIETEVIDELAPKLIGFLKRQETNGKFFSKAMQKELVTDMEEV